MPFPAFARGGGLGFTMLPSCSLGDVADGSPNGLRRNARIHASRASPKGGLSGRSDHAAVSGG